MLDKLPLSIMCVCVCGAGEMAAEQCYRRWGRQIWLWQHERQMQLLSKLTGIFWFSVDNLNLSETKSLLLCFLVLSRQWRKQYIRHLPCHAITFLIILPLYQLILLVDRGQGCKQLDQCCYVAVPWRGMNPQLWVRWQDSKPVVVVLADTYMLVEWSI